MRLAPLSSISRHPCLWVCVEHELVVELGDLEEVLLVGVPVRVNVVHAVVLLAHLRDLAVQAHLVGGHSLVPDLRSLQQLVLQEQAAELFVLNLLHHLLALAYHLSAQGVSGLEALLLLQPFQVLPRCLVLKSVEPLREEGLFELLGLVDYVLGEILVEPGVVLFPGQEVDHSLLSHALHSVQSVSGAVLLQIVKSDDLVWPYQRHLHVYRFQQSSLSLLSGGFIELGLDALGDFKLPLLDEVNAVRYFAFSVDHVSPPVQFLLQEVTQFVEVGP